MQDIPNPDAYIGEFIASLQGIQGCRGPAGQSSTTSGGGGCGCGCDCKHFESEIVMIDELDTPTDVNLPDILFEVWNRNMRVYYRDNGDAGIRYDGGDTVTVEANGHIRMLVINYEFVEEGNYILIDFKIYDKI